MILSIGGDIAKKFVEKKCGYVCLEKNIVFYMKNYRN